MQGEGRQLMQPRSLSHPLPPQGDMCSDGGGPLISMLHHTDAQPAANYEQHYDSVRAECC